jgi:branched-subunit amino acid aminotransferase/4-amino-4-deoxychorismate lyase
MSSVSMSEPGEGGVRAWDPHSGRWQTPSSGPQDSAYLAIDSWLVDQGRVRGLDRHRARFTQAVAAAQTHDPIDVQRFFEAAVAALPRSGRWFPRVELSQGPVAAAGELRLALRHAPTRLDEVVVFAHPYPDRRRAPRVKGPDLPRQLTLRAAVEAWDAGEALLASPDGTVSEGVWTSPLWWDGDLLCALPRSANVLDSVTRALVLELATQLGVEVGREAPSVARLRDSETWLVSALHGIRLVTGWMITPGQAPEPAPAVSGRAAAWQARLEALAAPLGDVRG